MEDSMSTENDVARQGSGEGAATGFYRGIRLIFRFLIVVLFGVVLGAAIYFGVPALYRAVVEPMQVNTQRIDDLELALAEERETARSRAAETGELVVDVEGRLAEQGELLAALQAEVEGLSSKQEEQHDQITRLLRLADQIESLNADLLETDARVADLETVLVEADLPAQRIERHLQLIRVMTLLTRARLWLIQDNLGLAADDVEISRDVLAAMLESATQDEADKLVPIITRLEQALEDLRIAPVIAADDLEIAWKLLTAATEPDFLSNNDTVDMSPEEGSNDTR
jgi:predicted RNase H-like nuclease (RuvC/YqgF family)